jgi:hypothetical protein
LEQLRNGLLGAAGALLQSTTDGFAHLGANALALAAVLLMALEIGEDSVLGDTRAKALEQLLEALTFLKPNLQRPSTPFLNSGTPLQSERRKTYQDKLNGHSPHPSTGVWCEIFVAERVPVATGQLKNRGADLIGEARGREVLVSFDGSQEGRRNPETKRDLANGQPRCKSPVIELRPHRNRDSRHRRTTLQCEAGNAQPEE